MTHDPIVITAAKRTPNGAFQGALKQLKASELGALAVQAAWQDTGGLVVDDVIMGCVLAAGIGQAPARQAALGAGLPVATPATTLNKVCGSGLRAIMLAADSIKAGSASVVVAGGMESMTQAPYLLDKARQGYRMGHGKVVDHMFFDGLEDAYEKGALMGHLAEATAAAYGVDRAAQDAFAQLSIERARAATAHGDFSAEIVPVALNEGTLAEDEPVKNARPEKIPVLKPVFKSDGTITAANASGIADGAAAVVVTKLSVATQAGLTPRAKIVGYTQYSHEPKWFTTAPIGAIKALLTQLQWTSQDVDLWEINEAFAVVTLAAIKELGLDAARVNLAGGACAMGHPIGATGARLVVTLLHALERKGLKRGIAAPCIGGGEAVALAIELL